MIQNTLQFVQLFDGDGLIVTHADVAQNVEVYSFKLLQEFGRLQLKSVWKAFAASLSCGQEDVLLVSQPRRWPLCEECVSCLSLFVSFTGAELCCFWKALSPPALREKHPSDRAGTSSRPLCRVHKT